MGVVKIKDKTFKTSIPEAEILKKVQVVADRINKDYEGYSRAADLVGGFADAAHELGIGLMGENALAGELYGEQGWRQMASALRRSPGYGGLTLLRMQNFFEENRTPRERLQWLINQFQ